MVARDHGHVRRGPPDRWSPSAAAGTLYAPAIAGACGQRLVQDSIVVLMEASVYSFSFEHLYLLDRADTPLVYFSGY